jgi:hypothetical protein
VCKRLVDAVNAELMLFDWKNGPLRHKYDSIKYVVRQLEDKLFELSLQEDVDTDLSACSFPSLLAPPILAHFQRCSK